MYVQYRREKRSTDKVMGRAVQMCTAKRLFSQWHRHLNMRVGMRMVEATMFEARVREVFRRMKRKQEFEEEVVRHMGMFNAFKLMEITLVKGLKRKVDNRDRWIENT